MSNVEAMEFVSRGKRLEKPVACPLAIYSVMLAMWRPAWRDRPTFTTIATAMHAMHSRAVAGDPFAGTFRVEE